MKKYFTLLFILLFLFIIMSGCGKKQVALAELPYTLYKDLPTDYSPEQALEDGYLVIYTEETGTKGAAAQLYGGAEIWEAFLEQSEAGRDSQMGAISFWGDGTISCEILIYEDGRYFYMESASDLELERSSFQYLRKLTGTLPNAAREGFAYVLTDSQDLTYYDVFKNLLSSTIELGEEIEYVWLHFPTYCEMADTIAA